MWRFLLLAVVVAQGLAIPGCAVAQTSAAPVSDLSNPLWSIPLARLTATRDYPLLMPDRRPLPAAAEGAAPMTRQPEAPPPPPPFILLGTAISDSEKVAVLFDKGANAPIRLRVGAEASGWALASVSGRTAILKRGSQSTTLTIPPPGAAPAGMPVSNEPE